MAFARPKGPEVLLMTLRLEACSTRRETSLRVLFKIWTLFGNVKLCSRRD